jgi:type II restriction enzyme
LVNQIPNDGKITIVSAGVAVPVQSVRAEFSRVRRLAELPPSLRGWTVDVLNLIRRLGKAQFSLGELYEFEPELRAKHPQNQNIRPKLRQQLQILRDIDLIQFDQPGRYSLRS